MGEPPARAGGSWNSNAGDNYETHANSKAEKDHESHENKCIRYGLRITINKQLAYSPRSQTPFGNAFRETPFHESFTYRIPTCEFKAVNRTRPE